MRASFLQELTKDELWRVLELRIVSWPNMTKVIDGTVAEVFQSSVFGLTDDEVMVDEEHQFNRYKDVVLVSSPTSFNIIVCKSVGAAEAFMTYAEELVSAWHFVHGRDAA